MTVLERENVIGTATGFFGPGAQVSQSTQSNPVTRRVSVEGVAGDFETQEIQRNAPFYGAIVERIAVAAPVLVDADSIL